MAAVEVEATQIPPLNGRCEHRWFSWLPSWKPTSEAHLEEAEGRVLTALTSDYKLSFVPVGPNAVIRTITMEPEEAVDGVEPEGVPLVMVHGFGCSFVQFYKNLDHIRSKRTVFGIDLPGFGRSTRVPFTPDSQTAEEEFVEAIEKWRQGVGLDEFILLGHSLGGFLSCAYAMKHPSRVRHLILVDPWGFPVCPENFEFRNVRMRGRSRLLIKAIAPIATRINPLSPVRAAGPLGPYLINRFRPDLASKFNESFMQYIYHGNAQNPTFLSLISKLITDNKQSTLLLTFAPGLHFSHDYTVQIKLGGGSGEIAFSNMRSRFAWAQRPMLTRVDTELDSSVPITFIYGADSWMDSSSGEITREKRPNSYVEVHTVQEAGHHVYADQPETFNSLVNQVCSKADEGKDLPSPNTTLTDHVTPDSDHDSGSI